MNYLDDLLFWVKERETIFKKKERGDPRPWTTDPVLAEYRFCNVRREDDRVTKWIYNNWLLPMDGADSLPFAMTLARMVNLPETLSELGYPHKWDANHFISVLASRKERGEKVWTSAYMITGGFSKGGEPKEVIIARILEQAHHNLKYQPLTARDILGTAVEKIKTPGIGSFLSAQVIADLKWSDYLRDALDWYTWCAPGPGSQMGLNFLHGRPRAFGIPGPQFMIEVNEVRHLLSDNGLGGLCAQNTQNCLCEFSKYVRAKHFGERLKSRYVPA